VHRTAEVYERYAGRLDSREARATPLSKDRAIITEAPHDAPEGRLDEYTRVLAPQGHLQDFAAEA
jgi:hypothetical protein